MDWNSDNDTSARQPKPRRNSDLNDKCVFWYMCNVCFKAYSNVDSFVTHRIETHGPGIQPRELKPKPKPMQDNAKDCNNNVASKSEYCLKLRNSIKSRDPAAEIQDKIEDILPEEIQNQNDRPEEAPNQIWKFESNSVDAVAANNDNDYTTLPLPEPNKQHQARRRITQIEKKRRRHLTIFQKDCTNKLLKQVLISNFMKDNLITASPPSPRKIPFNNKDNTKKVNILPKCFKVKWNFLERSSREFNKQNPQRQSSRNSKGSISTHMVLKPEHSQESSCELLDSKQSQSTDCELDIYQVTVNDPDLSLCNSGFNFFENLKSRVNSRLTFVRKETRLTELSSSLTV